MDPRLFTVIAELGGTIADLRGQLHQGNAEREAAARRADDAEARVVQLTEMLNEAKAAGAPASNGAGEAVPTDA